MKVEFYVLQRNAAAETREHFVFIDEVTELATNNKVTYNKTQYQVDSIEIIDRDKRELKAVCREF